MGAAVVDQTELGTRIAQARAIAGLTQAELAERTAIERTALAKIESGTRKLSATELVDLASVLDRPVDWFFSPSPPAVVSRRTDPAVGGRSPGLDSRVERIARDVESLITDGVLLSSPVPLLAVPSTVTEAEQLAHETRTYLDVQAGPLLDLQAHVEKVGLLAFSLDLGQAGGDAAYVALGTSGVAVINGAMDPGRRRFNLAHELGHHLFGDAYAPEVGLSPQDETEKLINAYAIYLLLPRESVHRTWDDFDGKARLAAAALAVRFRVSWSAVTAQLRNLGLIDAGEREELAGRQLGRADFVELGERWMPEIEAPAVPPQYGRRVLAAYRRGKLTAARTTELLWGTVAEVDLRPQDELPIEALRREFDPHP